MRNLKVEMVESARKVWLMEKAIEQFDEDEIEREWFRAARTKNQTLKRRKKKFDELLQGKIDNGEVIDRFNPDEDISALIKEMLYLAYLVDSLFMEFTKKAML